MSDRELLESAAKAAGIKIDQSPCNGGGSGNTGFDVAGNAVLDWHNGKTWNPLTNDGDALRLAVKLKLSVCVEIDQTWICAHGVEAKPLCFEDHGNDSCAATRRAITRAAAIIRAMGEG